MDRELAAQTVELLQGLIISTLAAAGVKEHKLPKLIRVPRPGDTAARPKPSAADKLRSLHAQLMTL